LATGSKTFSCQLMNTASATTPNKNYAKDGTCTLINGRKLRMTILETDSANSNTDLEY